ncbi:MAG: hypothetical protein ACQEQI_01220 [Bacillota bacterium]
MIEALIAIAVVLIVMTCLVANYIQLSLTYCYYFHQDLRSLIVELYRPFGQDKVDYGRLKYWEEDYRQIFLD